MQDTLTIRDEALADAVIAQRLAAAPLMAVLIAVWADERPPLVLVLPERRALDYAAAIMLVQDAPDEVRVTR